MAGKRKKGGRSNSRGSGPEHVPVRPHEESGSDRGRNPNRAKRARGGSAKHLIYGVHACLAVLNNPERQIKSVYVTRQTHERNAEVIDEALAEHRRSGISAPVSYEVMPKDLDEMVGPDSVHQGIAIDAVPLEEPELDDLTCYNDETASGLLMVLDQVTDPHNVGAIMRSAAVFGADALIVHERHSAPLTPTLLKTACGAGELIPLIRVTNISRTLEHLAEKDFISIGLAEEGQEDLSHFSKTKRVALVMGAEGSGIRRLVRDKCSFLARLPSPGPLDTLNVSNAAAVALYEFVRG